MSNIEETAYEILSGDTYFTVTAASRWSKNMCRRLKERFPDDVTIVVENEDGSLFVRFPSSWFPKIRPPRKTKPMTEEQRKVIADRLAAGKAKKLPE